MTRKSCLILLNGELPDRGAVLRAARACRGVLCADGGARHAKALRLRPDFVVGDMDSLPRPLPRWPGTVFWCDFDEDRTDFEKALDLARVLGCERAYVAGSRGGRLDQWMGNLAVAAAAPLEVVLIDQGLAFCLGPGRKRLRLARGRRFSLLAAPRARVSISGARYAAKGLELRAGGRGLGNEARGPVTVAVEEGRAWLLVGQGAGARLNFAA